MSCQSCHVDPAGGGLRNSVGRFYGRSTLPMIATSPRPTQDWDREFIGPLYRKDRATSYTDSLPPSPATLEESRDPKYAPRDFWAWGEPIGGTSRYSLFQGRMGRLNADPLFRVGWTSGWRCWPAPAPSPSRCRWTSARPSTRSNMSR